MQVCPAVIVGAPPEVVWELVTSPQRYDSWIDGRVVRATPSGPARPGQQIEVATQALGRRWRASIEVLEVDAEGRHLGLRVALPLGMVNRELVTLSAVDGGRRTLLRFS